MHSSWRSSLQHGTHQSSGGMDYCDAKRGYQLQRCQELQAILLMEADFNFTNNLFYGKHMMEWAKEHNEALQECSGR